MCFRIAFALFFIVLTGCGVGNVAGIIATASPALPDVETRRLFVADGDLDFYYTAVSPDGRWAAYNSWRHGDLTVRDLKTGETHIVASGDDYANGFAEVPVFSPDSRRIVYAWCCGTSGMDEGGYTLRTVNVNGTEPAILLMDPGNLQKESSEGKWFQHLEPAAWSPDGHFILASLRYRPEGAASDHSSPAEQASWNQSHKSVLALVSADDGSIEILKPYQPLLWKAGFSADGKYIAYDIQEPGQPREVFTMRLDGRRESKVATGRFLAWHPSGSGILFGDDDGIQMVAIQNGIPAGPPQIVDPGRVRYDQIGVAAGDFYYGVVAESPRLHTLSVDLARGEVLTPATPLISPSGRSDQGIWSPDGRYLAYTGGRLLMVRPAEGGVGREFRMPVGFAAKHWIHWLPDSSGLLMSDRVRGREPAGAVFRLDLKDGKFSKVLDSQLRGWSTFDTRTFFRMRPDPDSSDPSGSGGSKMNIIQAFDLTTREEKTVSKFEVPASGDDPCEMAKGIQGGLGVAPGSTRLALSTGRCIGIVELPGGKLNWIYHHEGTSPIDNYPVWSPDGKWLLFNTLDSEVEGVRQLWRVAGTGGEAIRLLSYPALRNFQLHPDGRRLVFFGGKSRVELWVMKNLPDLP